MNTTLTCEKKLQLTTGLDALHDCVAGLASFGARVYEKQLVTYSTVFSFPSLRNSGGLVPGAPVLVQTQVVRGQIHWQLRFGGSRPCVSL